MAVDIRSAEAMLRLHQGKGPAGISIGVDEWLRLTDLGALSRRTEEIRAIDDALRSYHLQKGTEPAFIRLKSAFDNWIRFQQRQGKVWKQSDRNKNGAITRLFDQITLVEAGRSIAGMKSGDYAARQEILTAERSALDRLFKGRTMVFKQAVKPRLGVVAMPAASAGLAIGKMATSGLQAVKPGDVAGACRQILGQTPPEMLFQMLGTSFSGFCSAASTIIGAAVSPVMLLADIVKAGMAANNLHNISSARYMFREGSADAALNAMIQMINDELVMIAKDAAQQVASITATAFGVGPLVSVANGVIDVMVNMKLYNALCVEMQAANLALAKGTLGAELFNASPVLGSYFLLMADTSVWINFSVHDIGSPGWMDTIETMRKRAEPVRDKARDLVRTSKIALSGSEGFNGVEWEPTWRNNKLSYLASFSKIENIAGKIEGAVRSGPDPKKPDPGRITGKGSSSGAGPS